MNTRLQKIYLLLTIIILFTGSCANEDDPGPQEVVLTVIIDEEFIFDYEHTFLLITTTTNEQLAYFEIFPGETYSVEAPINKNLEMVNIHIVNYNKTGHNVLRIKSIIGYSSSTYELIPEPSFVWGDKIATVNFDTESEKYNQFLLSAGTVFATQNGILDEFDKYGKTLEWPLYDNVNGFYFINTGSNNEGYYFDANYHPADGTITIDENLLRPINELSTVGYNIQYPYNLKQLSVDALLKEINGKPQYPVKIHYSRFNALDYLYYPNDIDDISGFRVNLKAKDAVINNQEYESQITSNTPIIPELLETKITYLNDTPGQIKLQLEGDYDKVNYSIHASDFQLNSHSWTVTFDNESIDYSSYPNFPDEFYREVPYGTIQNLMRDETKDIYTISTKVTVFDSQGYRSTKKFLY